ncbi:MAG: HD domain-containing protein [Synergistaceae bacterium]|nr:HD domain-containing protein [Synergistaceae bacterium]
MQLKHSVFDIVKDVMSLHNAAYADHAIRVAYIFLAMSQFDEKINVETLHNLILLCMFHDIGAFKTEKDTDQLGFEVSNTLSHSVYGYLFIKHLSHLSACAPVILYHHLHYNKREMCRFKQKDYAMRLCLADRLDMCISAGYNDETVMRHIVNRSGSMFSPYDVKLLTDADKRHNILASLRDGSYEEAVRNYFNNYVYKDEMREDLIVTLSMTQDFINEKMVAHSIETAQYAETLGRCFGVRGVAEEKLLYFAGLFHDIGKAEVPDEILRKQSFLDAEENAIFRKHPVYTRQIISRIFEGDIIEIASRHHEALNGSGYPDSLSDRDLTIPQKILAAANMLSKLLGRRGSGPASADEGDMLIMLNGMVDKGKLDRRVVRVLFDNYNRIVHTTAIDPQKILKRYESIKKNYNACIKKYSILDNTFRNNVSVYNDFRLLFDYSCLEKNLAYKSFNFSRSTDLNFS